MCNTRKIKTEIQSVIDVCTRESKTKSWISINY